MKKTVLRKKVTRSRPKLFLRNALVNIKDVTGLVTVYRDFLNNLATDSQFQSDFEDAVHSRNHSEIINLFGAHDYEAYDCKVVFSRRKLRAPGDSNYQSYDCCQICCWSPSVDDSDGASRLCFEVCYLH